MRKIKLRHLHKIKIHHNRWLIWALSYAIFITIALVGFIQVTNVGFEDQIAAENEFMAWRSYRDQRLGFAVNYPGDWSIEVGSSASVNFAPIDRPADGVIVAKLNSHNEDEIRASMQIVGEKSVTIEGFSGSMITNDIGDGTYKVAVLVKKNSNLYVINGDPGFVEKFLVTFRFIN